MPKSVYSESVTPTMSVRDALMTRKTNTLTPSVRGAKVNKIHVSETYSREILFAAGVQP